MAYSYDRQSEMTESTENSTADTGVDAVGNQARTDQAGLSGGDDRDYGLSGDFAGVLLEGMPLEEAVPAARAHMDNPAVRGWLGRQDPRAVLDAADDLAAEIIDAAWPVGMAVEGAGELGLALGVSVEIPGRLSAERLADDGLRFEAEAGVRVAGSLGVGETVSGAREDDVAGAKAGAEAFLGARLEGVFDTRVADVDLADAAGLARPDVIQGAAEQEGIRGLPGLADIEEFVRRFSADFQGWSVAGEFGYGVEAEVVVAMDDLTEILPQPDLVEIVDLVAGIRAELAGLAEVETRIAPPDGAWVTLRASAGGLLAARARVEQLFPLDDMALLAEQIGAESTIEIVATLGTETAEGHSFGERGGLTVRVLERCETTESETETALEFGSLGDAARFYANRATLGVELLAETPLAELLADVETLAITRSIVRSLDPERLDEELPGWLVDVVGHVPDAFFVGAESEIQLEGAARVGGEALHAAAAAGLVVPAGVRLDVALSDVSRGILAVRFGQEPPGWLAPQTDCLAAAAALVPDLIDARLVGRLTVGLGASKDFGRLVGTKASGNAQASVRVDRPVSGRELVAVESAVSSLA